MVSVEKEIVKVSKVIEKREHSAHRWHGNSYGRHILNICKSLLNLRKILNPWKLGLQQIRENSNTCLVRNCSICCIFCCSSRCGIWRRSWWRRRIGAGQVLISDIFGCTFRARIWSKVAGVAVRHGASIAYA